MSALILPEEKNFSSTPVEKASKITDKLPILTPWKWSYTGKVSQIHSNTKTVTLKDGSNKTVKLHEFIDEKVPAFKDNATFSLKPTYFTGMLQTLALSDPSLNKFFKIFYGREVFTYKDGGVCSVDYVMNNNKGWKNKYSFEFLKNGKISGFDKDTFKKDEEATHLQDWPRLHPRTKYLTTEELEEVKASKTKPLVLICHGLCGGSHETIIRATIDKIDLDVFDVAVINSRGCARTKIMSEKLFSAYSTDDIREIVTAKLNDNPDRHIYLMGFSFGATIVSNYLGEEGDKCPIKTAVTISNPWDMIYSYEKMTFDFWAKRLCSKNIVKFLVRTVEVNLPSLEKFREENVAKHTSNAHVFTKENMKKAKAFQTTAEFDDTFTAPYMGFNSAVEYYSNAGSINRLPNIKIPLLAINSEDDPVVGETSKNLQNVILNNENVMYISTSLGGHLAYLTSDNDSFITEPVAQYLSSFEKHLA